MAAALGGGPEPFLPPSRYLTLFDHFICRFLVESLQFRAISAHLFVRRISCNTSNSGLSFYLCYFVSGLFYMSLGSLFCAKNAATIESLTCISLYSSLKMQFPWPRNFQMAQALWRHTGGNGVFL